MRSIRQTWGQPSHSVGILIKLSVVNGARNAGFGQVQVSSTGQEDALSNIFDLELPDLRELAEDELKWGPGAPNISRIHSIPGVLFGIFPCSLQRVLLGGRANVALPCIFFFFIPIY
jgi:hypothetical protein